jgi:hypothetical protein
VSQRFWGEREGWKKFVSGLVSAEKKERTRCKVDTLVGRLPQSRQADSPVERREPFLLDDPVHRMSGIAVLWHFERIRERVQLGLEPDLDHLHRGHDEDGFSRSRQQSSFSFSQSERGARSGSGNGGEMESEKRTHRRRLCQSQPSQSPCPPTFPCTLHPLKHHTKPQTSAS